MEEAALAFEQVRKTYDGLAALAGCSLSVRPGEIFGLTGVNGAGKTTLIKCLLDFAAPDSGSIHIFGVPAASPAARRDIAFLPERFQPPYYLTGRDFLRYMLALHRAPYAQARVEAVFGALDLDLRALGLPVRAFSKGMTQKLGLAACLLSGKKLHVLDEPSSGLDPKARALFKRELLRLRSEGRTVFVTSHLLADIEQLCDRMAVLHAGEIRYLGTPAGLVERYRSSGVEEAFLACIGHDVEAARQAGEA